MAINNGLFVGLFCAVTCMVSGAALAQERTQEETLYYTDPTVAAPGRTVLGVSGELWGVYGPESYHVNFNSPTGPLKTSNVTAYQYGGSAYIGRGDWTLLLEGLTGRSTRSRVATLGTGTTPYTLSYPLEQWDLSLRYTFSKVNWGRVTPYLVGGFDTLHTPQTYKATAPNVIYAYTGTSTLDQDLRYNTAYLGAGILYEFNAKAGFRFDLDAGVGTASSRFTNLLPSLAAINPKATGIGGAVLLHTTLYYKVLPELTVQVGLKGAAIANSKVPPREGIGAYISAGYIHQF